MDDVVVTHSDLYQSWQNHLFNFSLDDPATKAPGLRKPQLAALYATLGHLVVDPSSTATVVMPTGTGKTDTMLALVIAATMPLSAELRLIPLTSFCGPRFRYTGNAQNPDGLVAHERLTLRGAIGD